MKDIEDRIKELENELKELREEEKIQDKQGELKPWKPEVKEKYFYIRDTLETGSYLNLGSPIDYKIITAGNCFRTKKRAEQVAEKVRLLLRMEQLHDMLCPDYVPDWEDENGYTLCLRRDYINNRWMEYNWGGDEVFPVYFNSVANVHKAAKILNRELELELDEK